MVLETEPNSERPGRQNKDLEMNDAIANLIKQMSTVLCIQQIMYILSKHSCHESGACVRS